MMASYGYRFCDGTSSRRDDLAQLLLLLEKHDIGKVFFQAIGDTLERSEITLRGGTVVDATLIISADFSPLF